MFLVAVALARDVVLMERERREDRYRRWRLAMGFNRLFVDEGP
jgi:hypothetical protein